jgi:mannose-1-phosphate guanylyltransferase
LWPLSRAVHPKQFQAVNGDETMLQATVKRLEGYDSQPPIVICNDEHRFLVAEQLKEIGDLGSVILEPFGRDTAPAIALAALHVIEEDPLLLVLPADHHISNQTEFLKALDHAVPLAQDGKLVTFGILPDKPHSGYGYIKRSAKCGNGFLVDSFIEKPSLETAKKYLLEGDYYWNSGMFLFKASRYLKELEKFRKDIFDACSKSINHIVTDLDFIRIGKEDFQACPSASIDYAIMENTTDAAVVPMEAGWSDLGSWASLWDQGNKDESGNVIRGDVVLHKAKNSYLRSDKQLLVANGVEDLIVVVSPDAVMVGHKDSVQDMKNIVEKLQANSRSEWEVHREVHRPWGKYDSVDSGSRFQVKRITVNPGAKLSLQMHHHRSEHWVVVTGSAKVTKNDKTFMLEENESTYIPIGTIHALENPTATKLEIIEVQVGNYLGEDDIVRYEDIYGR